MWVATSGMDAEYAKAIEMLRASEAGLRAISESTRLQKRGLRAIVWRPVEANA